MSLASFSLPDLQINGKCCNFKDCGDCFNTGDRIIMQPALQGSNEPTITVSTTKCCLFCVYDNDSDDENKLTWKVFQHYLELAYGKQASDFALGTKSIDPRNVENFNMPLRASEYQEIKEIAEHSLKRQYSLKTMLELARLNTALKKTEPLKIKEKHRNDELLESITSLQIKNQSLSGTEIFNIAVIKTILNQLSLSSILEEDDIEKITLLALNEILTAGKYITKCNKTQAKMLCYFKGLGFNINPPKYYNKLIPFVLRILCKSDITALSPKEYESYLQQAWSIILNKQKNLVRNIINPKTVSSSSESKILGHIQSIRSTSVFDNIKSTLVKIPELDSMLE